MSRPDARSAVACALGETRAKWCIVCKAETMVVVDVFAMFPSGITYITTVSACEICDDAGLEGNRN